MRIMLTNDDGIQSAGIRALYDEFCGENEIFIFAPDRQCSGFSQSITIGGSIKARRAAYGRAKAYEVFGTPADCVLLGLGIMADLRPDIVISGINDGYNAADDVRYSGTIGAACEACMEGVPALAVSTCGGNRDFAKTLEYTRALMDIMRAENRRDCFYSLNVPAGEVRGLVYAPLDGRVRAIDYSLASEKNGIIEYDMRSCVTDCRAGSDEDCLLHGWAAFTRLGRTWQA